MASRAISLSLRSAEGVLSDELRVVSVWRMTLGCDPAMTMTGGAGSASQQCEGERVVRRLCKRSRRTIRVPGIKKERR